MLPELVQAVDFNGVTHRGSGGVAFDQVDVTRFPASLFVSGTHGPKLTFRMRSQQVRSAIIRQADSCDDSVNMIPMSNGIAEAFQDKHTSTFADDQSVSFGTQWSTATSTR